MPHLPISPKGPGDRIDASEINEIIGAIERARSQAWSSSMHGTMTDAGTHIELADGRDNQNLIRDSFIGKIWPAGPNGEGDLPGSMYWVREVRMVPQQEFAIRPEFTPDVFFPQDWGGHWTQAVNLGEYNALSPDLETHSLIFGQTPYVRVHRTFDNEQGSPRFYFTRGQSAGVMAGVVRDIYDGDSLVVLVSAVNEDDSGDVTFVGDAVNLRTWIGLRSRHYAPFVWPPDTSPQAEMNILPILTVDGVMRVVQQLRWSFPQLPSVEWPITDCSPTTPLEPGRAAP